MGKVKLSKHLSCKNCILKSKVVFKNKVIFCFGLTKKLRRPKDYYRFCIIENNNKNCTEIMLEELYTIIRGLAEILFMKRMKDIEKKYKK